MIEGLRNRLVGAWRLKEYSATARDGTVTYPMGADATGFVIYTPDGYMSAQLMSAGRAEYVSGEMQHGSIEEGAAAAAGYVAYSGPFSVDEGQGTLRHHVVVSLFPNWLGSTQERRVQLDGDTLTLSLAALTYEGVLATPRLIWRRAEPNLGPAPNAETSDTAH